MRISIDIKTRILGDEHRVFVVRPGARYRHYDDFLAQNAIILDLPYLDLTDGEPFLETPNIESQIRRSIEIRKWLLSGRHNGLPQPSYDLNEYVDAGSSTMRRRVSQLAAIGQAYFDKAAKGDLVVVPPQRFADSVLIGEILEDGWIKTTIEAYGQSRMYGRRVRWLAEIPKNQVPSYIVQLSQLPSAFVQIERRLAIWFYDRVYRNYFQAGRYQAEFKISSQQYGSSDDARLTAFLNFVAANQMAKIQGSAPTSIYESIFAELGEFEPDQRMSINSPGEIIVHAARITPLVFMCLLSLISVASPQEIFDVAMNNQLVLFNSEADPTDPCAAEVYNNTIEWLTLVGIQEWVEACNIALPAIEAVGVQSQSSVEIEV